MDRSRLALVVEGTENSLERAVSVRARSDNAPTELRDMALRCRRRKVS